MDNNVLKALNVIEQVNNVILGKDKQIREIMAAFLAGGHILLEDIPGVGKTTLATAFSKAMALDCKRVQFTPDVMPSDLTGYSVYRNDLGQFIYQPGSVFCNLLLADEINRTSPKTQSALLEVMEERKVSVEGVTREVPEPFIVIATQNPLGNAGTQSLPEAQMDRFMITLSIGYPDYESELDMAMSVGKQSRTSDMTPVVSIDDFISMQNEIYDVYMNESIYKYIVNLLLIAGMYILTRIYKRNVAFDFDVNLAEGLKNSGCQLRINVSNKTGIPITKIRLDVVVSYCDKKGKEYKKYRKNVKLYGGCKGRKDNMDLSVSLPYCGMADVKIVKAKVYDYTGLFYCTIKPLSIMNILIFPEVESSIYEGAFSQYESNNNIELYINRKGSSHDDIRQIREYQTGDSYRHIHWNLSSRTGDLLIKEFCGQVDREILVLLDTLPDDINNIERMSSFYDKTAMLVMGFIQDDTKVSVLWNDLNSGALCKQTVSDYDDLKNVYYILYRLHYNCRNNDTDISREYSLGEYIDKNIIKIDTSSDVTELLGENVYGEHAY